MKKFLLIVSILFVIVAIPVTIYLVSERQELRKKAAPATTLAFSPASTTKAVGSEFSLEVHINTGDNQVIAAELHIAFDPEILDAVTITNGALFPNVLTSGRVEAGTASITIGAPSSTQPVTGQGTAAVIRFKALAASLAPVLVTFAPNTLVTGLGEGSTSVLTGTTPGKVTITGSSTNETLPNATESARLELEGENEQDSSASGSASASATLEIITPTASSAAQLDRPTIKGTAAPGSKVTLTIYSDPITVVVTADSNGNWVYTPQTPLEPGPHTIVAAAGDGSETTTETFVVGTDSGVPVSGSSEHTVAILSLAILLIGVGFVYGKLSY